MSVVETAAERRRRQNRQAKAKNPGREQAHWRVRHALQHGILTRPEACERCGRVGKPGAHHDDYFKPLDVMWLCPKCHRARHAELKAEGETLPSPPSAPMESRRFGGPELPDEGWAGPLGSRRFHYFRRGKSLCHRWLYDGNEWGVALGAVQRDCVVCKRKLAEKAYDPFAVVVSSPTPGRDLAGRFLNPHRGSASPGGGETC